MWSDPLWCTVSIYSAPPGGSLMAGYALRLAQEQADHPSNRRRQATAVRSVGGLVDRLRRRRRPTAPRIPRQRTPAE